MSGMGPLDLNVVAAKIWMRRLLTFVNMALQHSESILTENQRLATQFINQVDAAAVYVNASTRFTDGGQFGLGRSGGKYSKTSCSWSNGIRGPTKYKWVCIGDYTS